MRVQWRRRETADWIWWSKLVEGVLQDSGGTCDALLVATGSSPTCRREERQFCSPVNGARPQRGTTISGQLNTADHWRWPTWKGSGVRMTDIIERHFSDTGLRDGGKIRVRASDFMVNEHERPIHKLWINKHKQVALCRVLMFMYQDMDAMHVGS